MSTPIPHTALKQFFKTDAGIDPNDLSELNKHIDTILSVHKQQESGNRIKKTTLAERTKASDKLQKFSHEVLLRDIYSPHARHAPIDRVDSTFSNHALKLARGLGQAVEGDNVDKDTVFKLGWDLYKTLVKTVYRRVPNLRANAYTRESTWVPKRVPISFKTGDDMMGWATEEFKGTLAEDVQRDAEVFAAKIDPNDYDSDEMDTANTVEGPEGSTELTLEALVPADIKICRDLEELDIKKRGPSEQLVVEERRDDNATNGVNREGSERAGEKARMDGVVQWMEGVDGI